jgi:hypothetical protein
MSSSSARCLEKSSARFSKIAIKLVRVSTISRPLPSLFGSLKSGKSAWERCWLALASGAMMRLLIWSPMSDVPLSATMSLKLAPVGTVISANGRPAYLSLTYLMNSSTRT